MTLIELFLHGIGWLIGGGLFLLMTLILVVAPIGAAAMFFREGDFGPALGMSGAAVFTLGIYLLAIARISEETGIGPWWIQMPQ